MSYEIEWIHVSCTRYYVEQCSALDLYISFDIDTDDGDFYGNNSINNLITRIDNSSYNNNTDFNS